MIVAPIGLHCYVLEGDNGAFYSLVKWKGRRLMSTGSEADYGSNLYPSNTRHIFSKAHQAYFFSKGSLSIGEQGRNYIAPLWSRTWLGDLTPRALINVKPKSVLYAKEEKTVRGVAQSRVRKLLGKGGLNTWRLPVHWSGLSSLLSFPAPAEPKLISRSSWEYFALRQGGVWGLTLETSAHACSESCHKMQ